VVEKNAYSPGGIANGAPRPPLYLLASDLIPAVNITVKDFSIWTESGNTVVNRISNIYGTGDDVYGPNDGIEVLEAGATPTTYTSAYTITTPPADWTEPPAPAWAAPSTGYGSKSLLTLKWEWC
jgi:rhamnogalacturonan hydrolase